MNKSFNKKADESRTVKGSKHTILQNSSYCFKILCSPCDKTFYRSRMTKFHKLTLHHKRPGQKHAWSFAFLRISFNGWMIFHINSVSKYSQSGGVTGKGSTSSIGCLHYSQDLFWHFHFINVRCKADFISYESTTQQILSIAILTSAKVQAASIRKYK